MALRPSLDVHFERNNLTPQELRGFPPGRFLIRAHHSYSTHYGRRLLQVVDSSSDQAAEITAWVDESKGQLKEADRLHDHDNQVFYLDDDGRLHSKSRPDCVVYCQINPNTRNFELVLKSGRGHPDDSARRACQFSYDYTSKVITVCVPAADSRSPEQSPNTDSATSVSSPLSLSDVIRKPFALELVPQRHHGRVVRFWNYYTGSAEDEERHLRTGVAQPVPIDAVDDSWHRGREVRVTPLLHPDGGSYPVTPYHKWDLIPLRE